MKEQFVPYEIAFELKKIRFDVPCVGYYTRIPEDNIDWLNIPESSLTKGKVKYGEWKNYNTKMYEKEGTISAPLLQQAFAWFRKKHKLVVCTDRDGGWWFFKIKDISSEDDAPPIDVEGGSVHKDEYEEAELECLKKLIEIVKNN